MRIDGYEITAFTNLNQDTCLKILDIVEREFGEIGDFLIEDDEVGFRVYRGYFESAPKLIKENEIELKLVEKSEYHFTIGYKIFITNAKN